MKTVKAILLYIVIVIGLIAAAIIVLKLDPGTIVIVSSLIILSIVFVIATYNIAFIIRNSRPSVPKVEEHQISDKIIILDQEDEVVPPLIPNPVSSMERFIAFASQPNDLGILVIELSAQLYIVMRDRTQEVTDMRVIKHLFRVLANNKPFPLFKIYKTFDRAPHSITYGSFRNGDLDDRYVFKYKNRYYMMKVSATNNLV